MYIEHFLVQAASVHQLCMTTNINDLSSVQNDNGVCCPDSAKSVTHDERGLASMAFIKVLKKKWPYPKIFGVGL